MTMPMAASAFNWVSVSRGVFTRIYSGPLVTGTPFEVLELALMSGPAATVVFTLNGYSAAYPFYTSNVNNSVLTSFAGSPPVGSTGNWAVILPYNVSPWSSGCLPTAP